MAVTYADLPKLNSKYERRVQIQNALEFQDMNVARTPSIGLFDDDRSFYDPSVCNIHIGTRNFVDIFKIEDEEEYLMALNYMRGHEAQHFRSTSDRPYALGIQRGCEKILEYISSKEEKTKRRFRKPADYADFANNVLPSMGIYLSYQLLSQIIAGIANSVEDGRIERIRSGKFPGYEPLRRYFRGKFWNSDYEFKPYTDICNDSKEKLRVITNQILSLATCQLYEKGFVVAYAGSPMIKEVNALMPFIARGVMAKSCRDMAEEVVHISEALAPYLYDVAKLSAGEIAARKALEEMLADMLKKIAESSPMMNGSNISENAEELDDGSNLSSAFPSSDLVITLDDETYDKLMEKSQKDGNKGGGLMIKREHPKEEEKKDENSSESQSGSGSGSKSEEESKKSSSSDGEKKSDEKSGSQTGSSGKDGEQDGQMDSSEIGEGDQMPDYSASGMGMDGGEQSSSSDGQDSSKGQESSADTESKSSQTSSQTGAGTDRNRKANRKEGEETLEKTSSAENDILNAMKEAAENARVDVERQIESVNQATAHEKTVSKKREVIKSEPVDPKKFRDICSNFVEERRKYRLNVQTPAVMQARINAFARKNKRYLKSLSTPNVTNLDSGSVDPSLAYGLSFGNTEIFRKKGMDKKFDGCVYILLDNSGSMSGDKRTEACKAAAVVEGAFQGLMPMKIVAFDTQGCICHEVIKDWDEVTNNSCCWNFCVQGRDGGGNEDGYDIMIATREILARPERKKLIMVLSDGAPGNTGLVKRAVEDARKKGIEVYGIYFEEGCIGYDADTFKRMYQKDYVCCELSQVDENLSKLIKKFSRK